MSELTYPAPTGAHFEMDEVKTAKGTKSLGLVPILTWDDLSAAREHYGDEALLNVLDGTSLRVAFQSIARRGVTGNKSLDDIAKAQVEYKPGKRTAQPTTPEGRAAKAARSASAKVDPDALAAFLEKVAKGEASIPA